MIPEEEISQVVEGKNSYHHLLGSIKEMKDLKVAKKAIQRRRTIIEVEKGNIVKENITATIQVHIQVNLIQS